MDIKQKDLILAWHEQSKHAPNAYMKFMSNWIAFNAICYALYHKLAVKERADIDRKKSKIEKVSQRLILENHLIADKALIENKNEKWTIDLVLPERLFLTIQKTYTEDLIYNEFDNQWSEYFEHNVLFFELSRDLKETIKKDPFHYVINMSRIDKLDENDISDMIQRNIVIPLEEVSLSQVRKVLYQIRNNIFHGEKIPGQVNDDRIVKAANPLLNYIVSTCMKDLKIN